MSAGLDRIGSAMFSARGIVPWHNHPNCKVIDSVETIKQGIELAGANWEVEKRPLYHKENEGVYRESNTFALIRSDNGLIVGEGVGPFYTPLQNRAAFEWFQPFLDSKEVSLDTAGCLHGGSKVWILAKINRQPEEVLPNDPIEKFLMLSNSHDGTTSVRVGFTPIRVVCSNTLAMAHGNVASKLIRIKHSRFVNRNLENIKETIDAVNTAFVATAEQYKLLTRKDINQNDLRKYVQQVFEMPEKDGKLSTRSKNTIEEIVKLFESPKNAGLVGNNLWAAYNSINEYLNFHRGHNIDSRLNSLWFGQSAVTNQDALETALAMAI